MKKALAILSVFLPFTINAQIFERFTIPQDLPNLIPGYNQVTTINQQSLSFTYTLPPSDPTPIDGDTTTEVNGPLKYGEVIPTNYSLTNGNYTQTSQGKVWTLSIKVLGGAKNIGLTFDPITLVSNAEMYVYNESKTVLMGPVKAENFNQPGLITTGACKDSIITIYIIEKNSSSFQSSFIISQIIAGFIDLDIILEARLTINTSCMEHVQCFPDKMPSAHSVARIEVGGYLGTGTLINNENNNARPYFLTAFHLIDLNNDNQITSNEIDALRTSAFRFQFWRDACHSNNLNPGLYFTGAILRATRPTKGASDMALLELTNNPGLADGVTYAGWNRSTSAPSNNSSFIIHHPDGKDMRLTQTNSVGNYIFSDEYWQAYYQNGSAVARGSSGSALFNGSNQIVGQLKGGWSTCGIGFSDRYGKFSKSWNGGGTNETRLSNWLSPIQNLNSTNLFDPTTISIVGSNTVGCSGSNQYSLSNDLFDVNYLWTVTSNLQILGGQGTSSISVSRVSDGTATITVLLTSNKGYNRTLTRTKNVSVGNSFPQGVTTATSNNTNWNGPLLSSYSFFMSSGNWGLATFNIIDSRFTSFSWAPVNVPSGSAYWSTGGPQNNQLNINIKAVGSPYSSNTATIRLTAQTSCGVYTTDFSATAVVAGWYGFLITPNPTSDNVTVSVNNESAKSSNNQKIYAIKVIDLNGTVKKMIEYKLGVNTARITFEELTSGLYLVAVFDGTSWQSKQLVIQK